jgi:phosphohistidine phosphatase SixA
MKLYVMRHGPAEDFSASGRDFDRALTASGRGDDLEACRRVGMNAHLIKPVTMKALTEVVDHASTLRWPG